MATTKHKAPTQITLAPLAEPTGLERIVQRYWVFGVVAAIAITATVIFRVQMTQKAEAARKDSWDKFATRTNPDQLTRVPTAAPEVLAGLAGELKPTEAGPWARWIEAQAMFAKHDYAGAKASLETLRTDFPKHSLVVDAWDFGDGAKATAVDHLLATIDKQRQWETDHPRLFANPPPPADAPRVKLKTDRGDIVVALYSDRAPEHTASFLKLASEGYYNGTKFHRIQAGKWIDGGDPTSTAGEPSTWGKGGTDKVLGLEAKDLYHFAGMLTAANGAKPEESLGSRFSITCDANHMWDGSRVVFGSVVEGLDIVKQISGAELAPDTSDIPAQPVTLLGVEKL
jgi:cyclophilin family peptidyl-prolyl cis-trans isomerase